MSPDHEKTKAQLIAELSAARLEAETLRQSDSGGGQVTSEPERERSGKTLRESEARYRRLIMHSTDAIYLAGNDGRILDVNSAACAALGRDREEILGLGVWDIDPNYDHAAFQAFWSAQPEDTPLLFETTHRRKDGTDFPVEVNGIVFSKGGKRFFYGIARDISERTLAEKAVRENQERLANAQRLAHVGDWERIIDTDQITWSDELFRIFGFEPHDRKIIFDLVVHAIHPEDRGFYLATIEKAIRQGKPYSLEYRIVRPDGSIRHIRAQAETEMDETGKPVRTVGIVNDATEQKELEEASRKNEERLSQAARLVGLGYWEWDAITDKCIFCSDENARIHGMSAQEYIDGASKLNGAFRMVHPDDREAVRDHFKALRDGRGIDIEYRLTTPAGVVRHVREVARPLCDESGRVVRELGTIMDVTAMKQAENELRSATETAEFANRAKTEFLANMSHELRTPLNTISGGSQILAAEMFGPIDIPKYREYARDISDASEHLVGLINDLLDISRIETGQFELKEENLDVAGMVSSCHTLIKGSSDKAGLELRLEIENDLPPLRGDELRIKQVLLNLLSNAVKFTPRGGTVTLKATTGGEGHLVLAVADTGIGIASEDIGPAMNTLGKTGDPFTRDVQGAGLGLPLSKRLVELHGGTMELASEPGVGTTATVRFPEERTSRR